MMKTETILPTMTALGIPADLTDLTNWSKTARSSCHVVRARDIAGIMWALEVARAHGLSVIPHGAGHSYTDAALNTGGIVLDVTSMR
ncbi:MAG TPA: FAD-binding protein, partial [Ktedonobacterales bacterium]|nr:FAD-binding protein [Ktedonobacterales bacterium]